MKLSLGWRLYMDGAYRQAIALMVTVTPMARRDSPNPDGLLLEGMQ